MAKGNQKPSNGSALDFEARLWAAAGQAVPALHCKKPEYKPPFNISAWSRGDWMRQDVVAKPLTLS